MLSRATEYNVGTCTCTYIHPVDADYGHGPIKATKDKTSHGKREAQLFGFLSCLSRFLSLKEQAFDPLHNWYVSRISLELHQGVF